MTTPPTGGLREPILGTLILMLGVLVIAGLGVIAGHLPGRVDPEGPAAGRGGPLRTASDVLSGFPSIVLGYVGYVALVVGLRWKLSLLPP